MKKICVICLLLVVLWLGLGEKLFVPPDMPTQQTEYQVDTEKTICRLISVVDGDTITVIYKDKEEKVRLIGVDCPESVHLDESKNNQFGKMASEYTAGLLVGVENVELEFDVSERDDYGRLLAYVYIPNYEESLNYLLVAQGYAVNKEYQPNVEYATLFREACEEAKKRCNGLWSENGIYDVWN